MLRGPFDNDPSLAGMSTPTLAEVFPISI